MATRKYSKEAIQTAAGYLERNNGDTAQAAHDCDLQRIAIAPMFARNLEGAYDILRRFSAEKIRRAAATGSSAQQQEATQ